MTNFNLRLCWKQQTAHNSSKTTTISTKIQWLDLFTNHCKRFACFESFLKVVLVSKSWAKTKWQRGKLTKRERERVFPQLNDLLHE